MSAIKFVNIALRTKARRQIDQVNEILGDPEFDGLVLSLRQLYYQFVSRDLIKNSLQEYRRLARVVSDGRLCGLIDWDRIEDRGRRPTVWRFHESAREAVDKALETFNLDRWRGQQNHVELWVEKDALSSVFRPLASQFFAPMMINKGYSSTSAMFDSAQRMNYASAYHGRAPHVVYVGDFDPSGEDMVRDIRERLAMLGVKDLTVHKVALTWDQIAKFKPPPNPAKLSDPRAHEYVRKYGRQSWEVDALNPRQLTETIRKTLTRLIDVKKMKAVQEEEERQVETVKRQIGEQRRPVMVHLSQSREEETIEVTEEDERTLNRLVAEYEETIEDRDRIAEERISDLNKQRAQITELQSEVHTLRLYREHNKKLLRDSELKIRSLEAKLKQKKGKS